MKQATQTVPEGYRLHGTLNLAKSPRLFLLLNLLGVPVLVIAAAGFMALARVLRPAATTALLDEIAAGFNPVRGLLGLLAVLLVMVLVHEAIHGFFFWWFTRARPAFGVGAGYAYASAPGWYLPRNQYLVVGLAPLVVISLVGIGLVAVGPAAWLPALLAVMVSNASGAVGDMAVVVWLLTLPRETLASDDGDAVSVYVPGQKEKAP
jgi:hypothetical protein